jgi:hypothetical protein
MSILFVVVSFISVTLAWFAYSGLSNVATEVDIKAWYIQLEKDGETISNDIVISLSEIYPGMDIIQETVNIKNLGDSNAQVNYKIISARLLGKEEDNYIVDEETNSEYVEDVLAHEYPFHININLNKNYILAKGDESFFNVSISWPLDSDDDTLDSFWGTEAYKFQQEEETKKSLDENYQIKPAIQIVISLTAEQYLETDTTSDINYNLGNTILFDVIDNQKCTDISSTCLKTYVIDVNNKLGDKTVILLPDPNNTYLSGSYYDYNLLYETITNDWNVNTRQLLAEDILKIISTDVINSSLIRDNMSDLIIGNLNYGNRINTEINRAINYNGYYSFINAQFLYLTANDCYWTSSEYDIDNSFAVKSIDDNYSQIYGEDKMVNCKVIPIILANKSNL